MSEFLQSSLQVATFEDTITNRLSLWPSLPPFFFELSCPFEESPASIDMALAALVTRLLVGTSEVKAGDVCSRPAKHQEELFPRFVVGLLHHDTKAYCIRDSHLSAFHNERCLR